MLFVRANRALRIKGELLVLAVLCLQVEEFALVISNLALNGRIVALTHAATRCLGCSGPVAASG